MKPVSIIQQKNTAFILLLTLILSILIVRTDAQANEEYDLFLPIVFNSSDTSTSNSQAFKFSIAVPDNINRSTQEQLLKTLYPISDKYIGQPYKWNVGGNNLSTTQMIRACKGINYQYFCWNRNKKTIVSTHERSLAEWVAENKGLTWLIGNEPDNFNLNAGDGLHPADYGAFYLQAALTIKASDPTATLVFCQSTFPEIMDMENEQFPYNSGPEYCGKAYATIKANLPESIQPNEIIDAVATHHYVKKASETELDASINEWTQNLNNFALWVNSLDSGHLENTPLYLTEYGKLNNRCTETIQLRDSNDEKGGLACIKGETFYGRNSDEGYWGIQEKTTEFFLSEENKQWKAAWWYFTGCEDSNNIHGGLFESCNNQNPILSRAGETYRDNLDCQINNENCPETLVPTAIALNQRGILGVPVVLLVLAIAVLSLTLFVLKIMWQKYWKH